MRVALDTRPLTDFIHGGIPAYTREILSRLLTYLDIDITLLSTGLRIPTHTLAYDTKQVKSRHLRVPNKLLHGSISLSGRPYLDRSAGGADVFFAPNFPFVSVSPSCRLIVTAHDLGFVHYYHDLSPKNQAWLQWARPERVFTRADNIIAISQATKRDLIETWGIEENKINVVYSGITTLPYEEDRGGDAAVLRELRVDRPFILSLGAFERRKNLPFAVEAYLALPKKLRDAHEFILTGVPVWNRDPLLSKALGTSGVRSVGWVSERQKIALLRSATCLVYPSLYEGFGFPLLEALAAGTPIVGSHASVLPEIVGRAGILADPHDVAAFSEALRTMMEDDTVRTACIAEGRRRVRDFTWERTVQRTHEILTS